ncbi:hypothetical protein ACSBR1_006499 [Camellia fascicularis]
MDGFLDRLPSDDQDPPFPITVPSELKDSEYDQIIELGSATNPLVNSSGTNLNPDIRVEQQSEPQSLSISYEFKHLCPLHKLWCRRELEFKRQRQHELQLQHQLEQLQHQFELQCRRQLQLQLELQHQRQRQRQRQHLNRLCVDERYKQELYSLFNMFHDHKINEKKWDTAWKNLEEKYYYLGTDHLRFIHCGDVAGTSLSRLEAAGSSGYPSTSGYPPVTNACGGGVPVGIRFVNNSGDPSSSVKHSPPGKGKAPHEEGAGNPSTSGYPPGTRASVGGLPGGTGLVDNNGDPSSSVKHSPPGKGKVPHEEGACGFADVSGDAIGSMNASREGDLEMGLVNSNADPSALGDVRSSVVHHVNHTAAGSGVYGANVAMTGFQVATAAYGTATSKFAQALHTSSLTINMAAFVLDDTKWKAATPILTKAGSVVCGVGVLADIGKDLPLPLFLVAISTALLIIIVAILCAKRPT